MTGGLMMSKDRYKEEWRDKLKRFEAGELSSAEAEEFEKELNKLETLQQHMDEQEPSRKNYKPTERLNLRKTKWKLRFEQVGTIIAAFLLITIICSVVTNIFFMTGDRQVLYDDVVKRVYDITKPGVSLSGSGGGISPYFTKDKTYTIEKQIGSETQVIGSLSTRHFFSQLNTKDKVYDGSGEEPQFYTLKNTVTEMELIDKWSVLEKIADVSVSNVYITFDRNYSTEEVNRLFEDYDVEILFYPVDTGIADDDEPIGFPNDPMWLETDWTLESERKEGNTTSATYSAPGYDEGDTEILQEQFMKVLHFLNDYSKQTREVNYNLRSEALSSAISYLEEHGINHYGAVITGPTTEIIKMQDQEFIYAIDLDESDLYNWNR